MYGADTAMMDILVWLEESRLAVAIAGSALLYPTILALHSVGMAFVAGVNAAISLCVLGATPGLPLPPLRRLVPVVWMGFALNAITGLLLVIAAATRILTDPVFFLKMVFVALALVNFQMMTREIFSQPHGGELGFATSSGGVAVMPAALVTTKVKSLAIASFVLWSGAITLGRLLGYTFFRFWN